MTSRRPLLPCLAAFLLVVGAAAQDDRGFDPARLQRVGALLRGEVEAGRHAGAAWLIWRAGAVVEQDAVGVRDLASAAPMTTSTVVRIYSMSKIVTALAALQLHERGAFELDDPIGRWLPELAAPTVILRERIGDATARPASRPITVRMLLNHTAGFSYGFGADEVVDPLYRAADLWSAESLDEFVQKVATLPLAFEPGTRWHYSVSDDVLGALIERASRQPLDAYVQEHLTGPLGMVDTAFDVPDDRRRRLASLSTVEDGALRAAEPILGSWAEPGRGFPSGGGGMFSTLADWLRLCRAVLNGGELDGVRVLGRKTLELAGRNSLGPDQGGPAPGVGWSLFAAVRTDSGAAGQLGSDGMLYWSGAATTHFVIDPQEQLVAILLCQHVPYDQHHVLARFRTAVYQALR